jgi:hypothetical protein
LFAARRRRAGSKQVKRGGIQNAGAGACVSNFRAKGDELRAAVNLKF